MSERPGARAQIRAAVTSCDHPHERRPGHHVRPPRLPGFSGLHRGQGHHSGQGIHNGQRELRRAIPDTYRGAVPPAFSLLSVRDPRQRSTGLIEAPSCTVLRAFGPGGRCLRQATTPPQPASRDGPARSFLACSNRACPSTSPTRVARRTTAQGYRSHRWAWAGWLHQPCWSGWCPCRRRSTTSAPCRDVASSATNVRNTSAERGPWASDDMTGPPTTRRTRNAVLITGSR